MRAGRDGPRDEIIFPDAHFPAQSTGPQVIRADGLSVSDLLQAIIPLFELILRAPPLVMMAAVKATRSIPALKRVIAMLFVIRSAVPGYRSYRPLCVL